MNGKESENPAVQSRRPAAQRHQQEGSAVQLAGMAVEDSPRLVAQRQRIEGAFGPRPGAAAAQAIVQRKKFDFDGHSLDSARLDEFANFCSGMSRVNPDRLASLVPFLIRNRPGLQYDEIIDMCRLIWMAQGRGVPAVDNAMPAEFQAILTAAGPLGAPDRATRTVREAAKIHANADLIALAGPNARLFVTCFIGQQPETGFDNESAGAIRQRTGVLPVAWAGLAGDPQRINFFNNGFGNDPCICGRLNGVTEFLAQQSLGISEDELAGRNHDNALAMQIHGLAGTYFGNGPSNWPAFRAYLITNHPDIATHAKFNGSFEWARLAYD